MHALRSGSVVQSAQPARSTATLFSERQEEDLRIPAYIRRQLSIHDTREVGSGKQGARDADHNPLALGVKGEREDRIEKGLTDTPAYLRRKNNGV